MTTTPTSDHSASARLAELKGANRRAEFRLDREAVDTNTRTVNLAFASELPVERAWGREILDMRPSSVRLGRLNDGANLLVNHNGDDVVGVISTARVDPDRKARTEIRFGRSARAQEILQDVADGIRTKVSVGYLIHDVVLESRGDKNGSDTYRVTDWEPYEVSLVSIPADASVGVGRELDTRALDEVPKMNEQQEDVKTTSPKEPAPSVSVRELMANEKTVTEQAQRALVKRNSQIRELGRKFERWGGKDLADKAELDPTLTFDSFREQLLELVEQKQSRLSDMRQQPSGRMSFEQNTSGQPIDNSVPWGRGGREMVYAANLHAFKGVGKLMRMEDHEVAYRAGQWVRGAIFGDPGAVRWCQDHGVMLTQGTPDQLGYGQRAMTEGVFTSAGWLVPVEMETAIISNREQYGVARRICNVIPMGSASMTLPRVTSNITAYFVGEGTSGTESDSGGDQVQLNLKDLMAYTQIGKSTAMDAVIPLAEMVAREQARAFAIKEDACLVIGDGTSTYGGMRGLLTLLETAAYAGGRHTAATDVDTFPEVTNADTAGVIGKLPVYARAGARWLASGVFEALVFGRLKLTAGGNTGTELRNGVLESEYAGFPVSVAHDMPAGAATDYSSKAMAILGNFSLGVAFGSGSGMMMTVDPYTSAHLNLIRIITTERIDIVAHGVNKSTSVAGPIVCLYGH